MKTFKLWLERFEFPIPHGEAVKQGFLFHGMGSASFKELLNSEGFEGGGFATNPVKAYGPKFIAVRRQDMPEPVYDFGNGRNVQYTFRKPFKDFIPTKSEGDVKIYGYQTYAAPFKYLYLADEDGNVLGPLTQ